MNILIVGSEFSGEAFKELLQTDYPALNYKVAAEEKDIGDFIDRTDILVALRISDELLSRATRLQWIHCTITGTDNFERLPSFQSRKELLLTSSRGIHGPQMSEMAVMFMIAMNRRLPELIRNQQRKVWERWPSPVLLGKTVGIFGVGSIGRAIAEKCKAFGMTVYGIDPYPSETEFVDRFFSPRELGETVSRLDYFISVAPLTDATKGAIDKGVLSKMKPTACFINMGRGDVVDEAALIDHLRENKIAGAALDTFRTEPLPKDSPLWEMENVMVTPHIGGKSDIYGQQAASVFRHNLKLFLGNEHANMMNRVSRK
jgi:phosphoglycerate dehydrogenase-like enzyme